MPNVVFRGRSLVLGETETVLECLERHGVRAPFSCRAGHCRTCTMRAIDSEVPAHAQPNFKEDERTQGLFLPCVCRPQTDLVVVSAQDGPGMATTVISREALAQDVVRLDLLPSLPFPFRPGQFVHVVGPTGVTRPYSLASDPDGPLELHVRRHPGGAVSPWLVDEVSEGATVYVRGPFGQCHYRGDDPDRPVLLAGFSTGLAPLLGIVREAVARGHKGPIDLYHGARTLGGLYLLEELEVLASKHATLNVHFCSRDASDERAASEPLDDLILRGTNDLPRRHIFLSGSPIAVAKLERRLRDSSDVALDIVSDPFYFGRG